MAAYVKSTEGSIAYVFTKAEAQALNDLIEAGVRVTLETSMNGMTAEARRRVRDTVAISVTPGSRMGARID